MAEWTVDEYKKTASVYLLIMAVLPCPPFEINIWMYNKMLQVAGMVHTNGRLRKKARQARAPAAT